MRRSGSPFVYRPEGVGLLRASVVSLRDQISWWPDPGDVDACRVWLSEVRENPGFRDRLWETNSALCQRLDVVLDRGDGNSVRKMARTIAVYLQRERGRPTPLGLWAGVSPLGCGPAHAVWGSAHRAVARPDAGWLADVVSQLEAVPGLADRLTVTWNPLAAVRGDRMMLSRARETVSVRGTRAVLVTREAASRPIAFRVLVDKVAATVGGRTDAARAMLTTLVDQGFLITALRGASVVRDALEDAIGVVATADCSAAANLSATLVQVAATLRRHNTLAPIHSQAEQRRRLSAYMSRVSSAGRAPLAVDLVLDAAVSLPPAVWRETARAADTLLRLTREPDGHPDWRSYHRAFVDRFGTGALVPLPDLLDPDAGLGYPAGYPGSRFPSTPLPAAQVDDRDGRLLALAWAALADGNAELVLSDADVDALTAARLLEPACPVPAHVEIAVRVHAPSLAAVDAGDFSLTVAPARAAGILTSRFSVLAAGDGLSDMYRGLPTDTAGALPVQLSFPATFAAGNNVSRVPASLPHVLTLGEHPPVTGHDDATLLLGVADLAVLATRDRLHLVHRPLGRIVEPRVLHALALEKQAHPLVRFLDRLPRAWGPRFHRFTWGPHAENLPRLPRLRHRRIVLAPARWRLTADEFDIRTAADPALWRRAVSRWRDRWDCPDVVELIDDDRTLRLDLTVPLHVEVLRRRLADSAVLVLHETATPDDLGWIDGHVHEAAIALTSTRPPLHGPAVRDLPVLDVSTHGDLPNSATARWLSATVFAHPDRHDEIVSTHLPLLAAQLEDDAVWFVRYRSATEPDHLRVRIPVTMQTAAVHSARLGAWADDLRRRRTAHGLRLDTYAPEYGRYGDGPAMDAVEKVFAADSMTAAAFLAQKNSDVSRTTGVVAGMLGIAAAFLDSSDAAAAWLIGTPAPALDDDAPGPGRGVVALAVALGRRLLDGELTDWPASIVDAIRDRDEAVRTYRRILSEHAEHLDVDAVLASLMHMHHNRVAGINPAHERTCLRAARQAALSWRALRPKEIS